MKCEHAKDGAHKAYCKACFSSYMRERRRANPDAEREAKRRAEKIYRQRHPEKVNARRRAKYHRNKDTAHEAQRRRQRWLLDGTVTRSELLEIYQQDRGKCHYCGVHVQARFNPLDPRGFDHVIARKDGGKHEKENIVVCCRKCNELKG